MSDEKRPEWRCGIKEDLARWLLKNRVTTIRHGWKFTGEDTADYWLELHAGKEGHRQVPCGFLQHNRDVRLDPSSGGLLEISGHVSRNVEEIDAWEKKNARDLAEFRRLSAKFGGGAGASV